MNSLQLPAEFFKIRDKVIDSVHSNNLLPESINLIYEWLETDGWDSLLSSPFSKEYVAIDINQIDYNLSENELRDYEGIEEDEQITDSLKVIYTRSLVNNIIENGDFLSIFSYQLSNPKSNEAIVLGAVIQIQGQAGPNVTWWGGYASDEDFLKNLQNNQVLVLEGSDHLSDEEILSLWA